MRLPTRRNPNGEAIVLIEIAPGVYAQREIEGEGHCDYCGVFRETCYSYENNQNRQKRNKKFDTVKCYKAWMASGRQSPAYREAVRVNVAKAKRLLRQTRPVDELSAKRREKAAA